MERGKHCGQQPRIPFAQHDLYPGPHQIAFAEERVGNGELHFTYRHFPAGTKDPGYRVASDRDQLGVVIDAEVDADNIADLLDRHKLARIEFDIDDLPRAFWPARLRPVAEDREGQRLLADA